ncbi:3-hydroxy-3-methylglutaryl coenzyme A synthase [Favolaschia claudopus]|uniref:Hydroxymethylglutaryl-CoA synthase n=1 Tax=Favolaschia claudopus TaxID=2862362 RepID=A0AAW0D5Z7_9AGAR
MNCPAETADSTYDCDCRPKDVGILAMDMYFPLRCVSESDLENYTHASRGKYTIGLGQEYMAFADDREDTASFALNAVSSLLTKYTIDPSTIGRIDVGTESLLDKSKSIKTTLMDLFAPENNTDIEGVDSINACYGSTAALFNAINWIESRSWDGRNAIVVAVDIAVYKEGNARPVGGAGAVAMLVGPGAPVVFEPIHGTYMADTYDFYKPEMASEYPEVDGPESITTYLHALDESYKAFKAKTAQTTKRRKTHDNINTPTEAIPPSAFSLEDLDYALFHSPYNKLVEKAHARLLYNDFLSAPASPHFASLSDLERETILALPPSATLLDKSIEHLFMSLHPTQSSFDTKVLPTLLCSKRLGNMYTASLYACLASLISSVPGRELKGKRAGMYAFGGGCAGSFFVVRFRGEGEMKLEGMRGRMGLVGRLDEMRVVRCEEFEEALEMRERNHGKAGIEPEGSLENIRLGAFYLAGIDEKHRRKYLRKAGEERDADSTKLL